MSEIKPALRQMVDNNKPQWSPETIRGAHKQLDEYEKKAEAFDRIVEEVKLTEFEIREKELVSSDVGYRTLGKEITRFVLKEEEME